MLRVMRPDRWRLLPELLLIGVSLLGGLLTAVLSMTGNSIFAPGAPDWLFLTLMTLTFLGPFVGLLALVISLLFSSGRWWVQLVLIAVGAGLIAGARWWFWATRQEPIIFHPGFLPLILGVAVLFSGGVSLLWDLSVKDKPHPR